MIKSCTVHFSQVRAEKYKLYVLAKLKNKTNMLVWEKQIKTDSHVGSWPDSRKTNSENT